MAFTRTTWLSPLVPPLQCLKAEDIASAVTFVLSAPPHVQVCESVRLPSIPGGKGSESLIRVLSRQIGDVHMRPVEQVS